MVVGGESAFLDMLDSVLKRHIPEVIGSVGVFFKHLNPLIIWNSHVPFDLYLAHHSHLFQGMQDLREQLLAKQTVLITIHFI